MLSVAILAQMIRSNVPMAHLLEEILITTAAFLIAKTGNVIQSRCFVQMVIRTLIKTLKMIANMTNVHRDMLLHAETIPMYVSRVYQCLISKVVMLTLAVTQQGVLKVQPVQKIYVVDAMAFAVQNQN